MIIAERTSAVDLFKEREKKKKKPEFKIGSASYKLHDLRQVFNLCKRLFPGQNNDHNT